MLFPIHLKKDAKRDKERGIKITVVCIDATDDIAKAKSMHACM